MTIDDYYMLISDGLKKSQLLKKKLLLKYKSKSLKRIDKVFNKGLHFYLDPKSPEVSKDADIFRKSNLMQI